MIAPVPETLDIGTFYMNISNINERRIPPAAERDPNSWELMRVWVAEQGLHCSLKIGVYEKNGPVSEVVAWGTILADAAKHVADALEKEGIKNRKTALAEISEVFLSEVRFSTSDTIGDFVD